MSFRDNIYFLALTVAMEAGGELYEGKLAVAYTIVNRTVKEESVIDVIMRAWQFSAWNTDSPTRMNIDELLGDSFRWSYRAACEAYFRSVPDPTNGATHYLNEAVTRKLRGGTLPSWFDEKKVTGRIGNHTFLKGV